MKAIQKRNYHRIERRYGSFVRTVGLPTTVKADTISADLKDGILRLDIPKADQIKPRKINVAIKGNPTAIEAQNN